MSKYISILIIVIVSVGVYLNTLPNDFVYDDEDQILQNQWIKDVRYIPDVFLSGVWTFKFKDELHGNYYRPLMHIVFMIEYHLFGFNPWGFHLVNIIFHAGVSVMVFLIASMLFNKKLSEQHLLSPAFIAAILFAVHPIHTEVVAWVSSIPELSFTFFYLLSFYLYAMSSSSSYDSVLQKKKGQYFYVLSIISFFIGALFKEPTLTLPILLLVYDYSFPSSKFNTLYLKVKRYLPYLIAAVIYFLMRTYALKGFAPLKRHAELSNYQYFINIFPLFIQYLEKLILPINLNSFYALHPIYSILELKSIITISLTVMFGIFVYLCRQRNKTAFLNLLWIVIPILPALYIPGVGENTFAERYLYLPSVGFVILMSLGIEKIYHIGTNFKSVPKYSIVLILAVIIGLYSIGTIKRNYVWKDSYNLWVDTVAKTQDWYLPHNNMGLAHYNRGELDKAIKEYLIAISLKHDYAPAYNNLGNVYADKGQLDEAIKQYLTGLKFATTFVQVRIRYNLGTVYAEQGHLEDAIEQYKLALILKSDLVEARNDMGIAYLKQGRLDYAIEEFKTALSLNPNYVLAHYNLGISYMKQGLLHEAKEEFEIAMKLDPNDADIHLNLGKIYYREGRLDEAIKEFQITAKLKPDSMEAFKLIEDIKTRASPK